MPQERRPPRCGLAIAASATVGTVAVAAAILLSGPAQANGRAEPTRPLAGPASSGRGRPQRLNPSAA
jgi:hypothetical protein